MVEARTLALATEEEPPNESFHAEQLREILTAKVAHDYPTGTTKRDAHPKHHALVRAELTVEGGLPPELSVGLFASPRTYQAWVRFSNASGKVQADSIGDIRGAAMKLLDVPGPKLLPGSEEATTHDLVLISTDRFVTRDVEEFHGLVVALDGGLLRMGWFFVTHLRVAWNVLRASRAFGSLLDIPFTSPTPYLLGKNAVRYRLRPVASLGTPVPSRPDDDFLRLDLQRRLAAGDAVFDFMIQLQVDAKTMPIEDPGVAWDEEASPYRKVATLRIPAQDFGAPDRLNLAENISFNPWRCLAEHRPLGGINRARKTIYAALSSFRHDRNGVPVEEPTS